MTLRQLGTDGTWYCDFRYTCPHTGARKRHRQSLKTQSKREAAAQEARLRAGLEKGTVESARPTATVAGLANEWMRDVVDVDLSPSTAAGYATIVRCHIYPRWGHLHDVRLITPREVQAWKAELVREGRPAKTVANFLACLRSMLRTGVSWGVVETNAASPVALPRVRVDGNGPPPYFSPSEETRILKAAGKAYPMLRLLFCTGLRRGELYELRHPDVQLTWSRETSAPGHLHVRRALTRTRPRKGAPPEPLIKPPKSGRARYVPLPRVAVDLLRALPRHPHTDLLFTRDTPPPEGRDWHMGVNAAYVALAEACDRARVPRGGLHKVRHTYATRLVHHHTPLTTVQEYLGHADINTTMRYAHHCPPESGSFVDFFDEDAREERKTA
jgi:integrase